MPYSDLQLKTMRKFEQSTALVTYSHNPKFSVCQFAHGTNVLKATKLSNQKLNNRIDYFKVK